MFPDYFVNDLPDRSAANGEVTLGMVKSNTISQLTGRARQGDAYYNRTTYPEARASRGKR